MGSGERLFPGTTAVHYQMKISLILATCQGCCHGCFEDVFCLSAPVGQAGPSGPSGPSKTGERWSSRRTTRGVGATMTIGVTLQKPSGPVRFIFRLLTDRTDVAYRFWRFYLLKCACPANAWRRFSLIHTMYLTRISAARIFTFLGKGSGM